MMMVVMVMMAVLMVMTVVAMPGRGVRDRRKRDGGQNYESNDATHWCSSVDQAKPESPVARQLVRDRLN